MVSSKENAVKNFVYFCMNFSSDFIKNCWDNDKSQIPHLEEKFSAAYKKAGPEGCINRFMVELDEYNQQIFSAWINENYVGFPQFHEVDKIDKKKVMDKVENLW